MPETRPMLTDWHRLLLIYSFAALALVAMLTKEILTRQGLFDWIGCDYALYGAAARVVTERGWSHLYDEDAITEMSTPFWAYHGPMARPPQAGPSPYPAVFVLPFIVTNLCGPMGGFAAWTLANVLAVLVIIGRMLKGEERRGLPIYLATLAFAPVWYGLLMGQLAIVMTFGLYKSYRAFQVRREFEAGLWLGALLLKPQFALLLAIVLLGKARWKAAGGLFVSGLLLVLSTVYLVGIDGCFDYFRYLSTISGFRRVPSVVAPHDMINFRGILLNILPASFTEMHGKILVLVLSIVLTATLVIVWRGIWETSSDRFPRQVLATLIVAIFTGYHNHIHGATLLIVPALAVIADDRKRDPLIGLFALTVFLPTVVFSLLVAPRFAAWILMGLMASMYGLICVEPCGQSRPRMRSCTEAHPLPAAMS
jgi:hypothetical protein